jgi:quercetin dioxygenase-like cupin family protein
MQRFRVGPDAARPVADDGSAFRLARLLWARAGEVRVDLAYFEPGDRVGLHRAGLPQLFCVLRGAGWVQGEDAPEEPIGEGEAVLWHRGERHAARTDGGMAVLILQAEAVSPAAVLASAGPPAR